MKRKKLLRFFLILLVILCLCICIGSGIFLVQFYTATKRSEALTLQVKGPFSLPELLVQQPVQPEQTDPQPQESQSAPIPGQTPSSQTPVFQPLEETAVEPPVDFETLQALNPDIYAWLEIPGTDIDEPILQSSEDDLYYNSHGVDGKYFLCGAVFSQASYNSRDFDAPMTVLYGHNTVFGQAGAFMQLNNYADALFFDEHDTFYVYTPESILVYRVFAAYVHSNEHLMECYNFKNDSTFTWFFDYVQKYAGLYSVFDPDRLPQVGDRVLTLSTCFTRNFSQRFLVQAVLESEYPITSGIPEGQ